MLQTSSERILKKKGEKFMANSLIEKMKKGEKQAIIDGLSHSGAIYRMNAISFSSIFNVRDDEVKERIKSLKDDDITLDGYSVSDFAMAALDLMKIEKYTGGKASVKNLIDSKFDFLQQ